MAAIFAVEVVGFDALAAAVKQIEKSTAAQEALLQESNRLNRVLNTLVADGFAGLIKALSTSTTATNTNTGALKANNAETVKNITSITQLAAAWNNAELSVKDINAQLSRQVAESRMAATAVKDLTIRTQAEVVAVRELFIANQANIAAVNQTSSAYSKVAGLVGQRVNLENGVTGAMTRRVAAEQASLAIAKQKYGVEASAIAQLQARKIAESSLTREQSDRALSELGFVTNLNKVATNGTKATGVIKQLTTATVDMHAVMRGASGAAGALFLTYGNMAPMMASFLATMSAIKAIKVGAEFDQTAKYIAAIQDETHGAVLGLDAIKSGLLNIKGVGRTPQELADGMKELVKAGIPASEAIKEVANIARFATVVETDMAKASELVTSQWLAWGEASVGAARGVTSMGMAMDLIAYTIDKTKAGMDDMKTALVYLTPLAKMSKTTYVDMLAMAGALSNVGVAGSMMGTSIRTALIRTQAGVEKLTKKFAEYGVQFSAYADPQKKVLKEGIVMFDALFKAANKLAPAARTAMIATALGLRAASIAALDLGNEFDDAGNKIEKGAGEAEVDVIRLRDAIQQAKDASAMKQGFVGTIFEQISDNAVFKFAEIKAGLARAMAEGFDDKAVGAALDKLVNTVNSSGFKNLIKELMVLTTGLITAFAAIADGPLPEIATALGKVLVPLTAAIGLTMAWGVAMKAASFNVIVAAGAAGIMAGEWLNKFDAVKIGAATTIKAIIDGFINVKFSLQIAAVAIKIMFQEMWHDVKQSALDAYKFMADKAKYFQFMPGAVGTYATALANSGMESMSAGSINSAAGITKINQLESERSKQLALNLDTYNKQVASIGQQVVAETEVNSEVTEIQKQAMGLVNALNESAGGATKLAGGAGKAKEVISGINIDALSSDIARFTNESSSKFSQFSSQLSNEVDGYIEKVKKFAVQSKKSEESVWESLGTTEEGLRKIQEAKIEAFKTQQIEEFDNKIRDLGVEVQDFLKKADIGDKFQQGIRKIETAGTKLQNKIKDLAKDMFNEGQAKSYDDALNKILKTYGLSKNSLEDIVKLGKEAFADDIIDDYYDSIRDVESSISNISEEQKLLNEHTSKFDKLREKLESSKGAFDSKGPNEYAKEVARINALEEEALRNNVALLKSTNNMWNGFHAGAIEAQKDIKTLGQLGYDIFQDLHDGLKNMFVDVFKGNFDNINNSLKDMLKSMEDTIINWAADRMATATTNILDGILTEIGLGSFTERGGSASNPVYVYDTSGGGTGGGVTGAAGGILSGAKGWVTSVFGESAGNALGYITSALGVAGGAYGLYSGIKNMTKGNVGTGAVQTVAGGTAMYKGAVGLDLIAKGTATEIAKGVAGYFGLGTTTGAGAGIATMAPVGYSAGATQAPAWAGSYLTSQTTAITSAATTAATTAATSVATSAATAGVTAMAPLTYGTGTAAAPWAGSYLAGQTAATGSSVAGGSAGAASTTGLGAGATAAIGVAAFTFGKVLQEVIKGKGPSPSAEIDKAGITPKDLGAFNGAMRELSGTVLDAIPGVTRYNEAIYNQNNGLLILKDGSRVLELQYNATAQAGHQWSTAMSGSVTALSSAVGQIQGSNENLSSSFSSVANNLQLQADIFEASGDKAAASLLRSADAQKVYDYQLEKNYIDTLDVVKAGEQWGENATGMTVTMEEAARRQEDLKNKYDATTIAASALANGTQSMENNIGSLATTMTKMTSGTASMENSVESATQQFENMTSTLSDAQKYAYKLSTVSFPGTQSMENSANGGIIGYAGGGILRGGSGTRDDLYLGTVNGRAQLAMGGEYIINQKSTRKYKAALDLINADTYATGGDLPSLMSGVNDTIAKYTMSDAGYSKYQLNKEYNELKKSLVEAKATTDQLAKAQRSYDLELASIFGPTSDAVKNMMEGVNNTRVEANLSDTQKSIRNVNIQYNELIKNLKESGANATQVAQATHAWNIELDAIADQPLIAASESLKSFTDGLKGVTDEATTSTQAQAKLMTTLNKAKKGDFKGIENLADILSDITINKEDYASATDYARSYWRTIGASTELASLIDKKVAKPVEMPRVTKPVAKDQSKLTAAITAIRSVIPGFAEGGSHIGGLRIVGESGPELEYTGPSTIYNRDQLIDIEALLIELRALRQEVKYGNYAVAKNTMKTAESLQRIEYDGIYLDAGNL